MNCIIIEDEKNAIEYLEQLLKNVAPNITVQARLSTVEQTVAWLKQHKTDLIFLDVHLGDDLSFAIFDQLEVTIPIIFTTAYDNYAIEAFKLNSISYLLKPFHSEELKQAIDKVKFFSTQQPGYVTPQPSGTYQKRFLVNFGNNNMRLVRDEDISYIHTSNKYLFITCLDGNQYLFYGTLDGIEHKLDPERFFRINRKFIISINSIRDMQVLSRGRINIITTPQNKEEMVVSVERAQEFRKWLNH